MMIKQKSYQDWSSAEKVGIVSFDDVRMVQSFGIISFIVVTTVNNLLRLVEGQLEIPKKKPDPVPDDFEMEDLQKMSTSEGVKNLLLVLQRGWNKPRKDNALKIQEYAGRGVASDKPWDIAYFPEFTAYTPNKVFFEPYKAGGKTGRLALDLLTVLIDGITRGTGLHLLWRAAKGGCGDEEIVLRIIPGLPFSAARQVFSDINTTPIAVPFADILEKDVRRPAFRIALEISGAVKDIRAKSAYMFVQQALLGAKGETSKAEPFIPSDQEEGVKERLLAIVDCARKALGNRWGNEQHVLCSGYGLAAIGRLYFECGKDMPTFQAFMLDRVGKMSWDRNDERVQKAGFAEPGAKKVKNMLTSYPKIRGFAEFVRSEAWKDLALTAPEYDAFMKPVVEAQTGLPHVA